MKKMMLFFSFLFLYANLIAQDQFTVNSSDDYPDIDLADKVCADKNGNCTLRAAIENANKYPDKTLVFFNIPGIGPHRIKLKKNLPKLTETIILDATTQKDYQPGCLQIILDGAEVRGVTRKQRIENEDLTPTGFKLERNSSGSIIKGFVIGGFGKKIVDPKGRIIEFSMGCGININTENNLIESNFIGVEGDGKTRLPNIFGIYVISENNQIGSYNENERNVISGNWAGMLISSSKNKIIGNYIGTDWTGKKETGQITGLDFSPNGNNNFISSNLISANEYGVEIRSSNITFINNIVGPDVNKNISLPVQKKGIFIRASKENIIGLPGQGNIIAGNETGVYVADRFNPKINFRIFSKNNRISGNFFGTDVEGKLDLGNGIAIHCVGSYSNIIEENIIANSDDTGILLESTQLNIVRYNFIGTDCSGNINLSNGVGIKMIAEDTICAYNTIHDNLFSGNTIAGIEIKNADFNCFYDNKFMSSSKPKASLSSSKYAISLENANENLIGGATPDKKNIIKNYPVGIKIINTKPSDSLIPLISALKQNNKFSACEQSVLTTFK
ncbi:hypothetical protein C7S20_17205 [Christiangramia fulva]|uniref:Uncharacterized protein n=1 Tax=Christiangramia fulva TaxID=2126553 RepID=A0A2R3Z9C4_9FLAO|nr:NosD domain-containing protein [Christiangramia fulva]AVR46857.1 hypothetical protein C7S20_17205 [Christiangramia fulva]